jgi:lipoprotein-releasing system permease protein
VALSISVILLSIATLQGFKGEIERKVTDLHGDFIIDSGLNTENGEPKPIPDSLFSKLEDISKINGVKVAVASSSKACIVKSNEDLEGLIAKGIPKDKFTAYMGKYIKNGKLRAGSNWCVISTTTANRLKLDTGDRITIVFFVLDDLGNSRPRARRLTIDAIYETGVDQIDGQMILLDQMMLLPLQPSDAKYSQMEIWVDSGEDLERMRSQLLKELPTGYVRLNTLQEHNRLIFDWLSILNTNVLIILVLMSLVAIFGMSTTLLILIIERTSLIGLLSAMGSKFTDIGRVFLSQAMGISLLGLVIGNVFAFVLIWGQNTYKWIHLNQEVYFIPHVKFEISMTEILAVDICALLLIFLSLWLPATYIKKVDIIKAINFK